ncbi:MAG: META domain-containing protein [Chitinophagaceae bacterium]
MKKICAIALLLGSFSLSAVAQTAHHSKEDRKISAQRLLQGAWTLQWMKGGDVAKLYPVKKPVVSINVAYGKISGFNGCNNYFGAVKVEGDKLILKGPLGSTKMACDQVDEHRFMSLINDVKTFKIADSNSLELSTTQGVALRFTRLPKNSNLQNQPKK